MRCPDCGKKNPDTRKFCIECGKDLEKVRLRAQSVEYICPKCGHKGPSEEKFCEICGAQMPILLPWLDEDEEARMREKIAEYRACLDDIESAADPIAYADRYDSLNSEISSLKIDLNKYVTSFRRRWSDAAKAIRASKRRTKDSMITAESRKERSAFVLALLAIFSIPVVALIASIVVHFTMPAAASKWVIIGIVAVAYGGFCTLLHFYGMPHLSFINMIVSSVAAVAGIVFLCISPLRIFSIAIFAAIAVGAFMLFLFEESESNAKDVSLWVSFVALIVALWGITYYAAFNSAVTLFFDISSWVAFLAISILAVVISQVRDEACWLLIAAIPNLVLSCIVGFMSLELIPDATQIYSVMVFAFIEMLGFGVWFGVMEP